MNAIPKSRLMNIQSYFPLVAACAALSGFLLEVLAGQLPDPIITASATAYSGTYAATNMFGPDPWPFYEYASKSQGPVSAPLTTNVNDGTWAEFDFGAPVTFNQFVMRARGNAVDVIVESRLIISADPIFEATDTVFTFNPSGSNGTGLIQSFPPVTGRYVRWEVTQGTARGNLGVQQMWFMSTPPGHSVLPAPTVIDASPPFSGAYPPAGAVNGDVGNAGAAGHDYASAGIGANMFIDFDFGASKPISGFDFWNRPVDAVTAFDLIFADTPDFSVAIKTLSFTASADGNQAASATFEPVIARYVRLQATANAGGNNTGVNEIQFYTPGLRPPEITRDPQGATLFEGDKLALSVQAVGALPLFHQWWKDGAAILDATNAALTVWPSQAADSGRYFVVVTNSAGQATSQEAVVSVRAVTSIQSGLAGYWKLDEVAGLTAADASGQGNEGATWNGTGDGSQWVAGQVGGAMYFRGPGLGDDCVVVPNFPRALNGTMSLAAWVWAEARPDRARIACGGSGGNGVGQFLFTQSTGDSALRGYVGSADGVNTPNAKEAIPFPTNSWQHVVLVADSSKVRVYRNGAEVAAADYDGTLLLTSHALSLGARLNTDDTAIESGAWQGKIDDVAYWTRGLSYNEVVALFAAGSAGKDVTYADQYKLVAPSIVDPPKDLTIFATEAAAFEVKATGTAPLTYQWYKGDQAVAGATNATLALTGVTGAEAGSYTVVVSNPAGSATNGPPAVLTVNDPPVNLETGLVLHLKLDETSGWTASDTSGLDNHGALINFNDPAANWVAGILDGALRFNSGAPTDNQAVAVPAADSLDFSAGKAFSLAVWVNGATTQSESGGLLCKGLGGGAESYCIDCYQAAYRFFVRDETGTVVGVAQSAIAPNGTWQLLVAVFDQTLGRMKLYANGVEVASTTPTPTLLSNYDPLDLGCRQFQGGYTLPFNATIDDVRVYARGLTPKEQKALYELGVPPPVSLSIARSGGNVVISWSANATGLTLESTEQLPAASWQIVPGVVNNRVTVTPSEARRFYRLRK